MIPCNIHQISNLQRNHLVSFQFAVIGMNMKMTLRSPRVGVVVERFGDKRKYLYKIVENNPLCLIKPCTTLLPLAEISADAKIIGPDGQPVPATGEYYITAETMDPYHIVTDWF